MGGGGGVAGGKGEGVYPGITCLLWTKNGEEVGCVFVHPAYLVWTPFLCLSKKEKKTTTDG